MEETGTSLNKTDEDHKHLKWGLFYYDPGDKNFFHSKKNKDLGATINFAHPYAKYFVALFLLIIITPFLLIFFIAK